MAKNMIAIGDLLDHDQLKQVDKLIKSIRSKKEHTQSLRDYLVTQRASLEARGVLPEYLYYALCYTFGLFD